MKIGMTATQVADGLAEVNNVLRPGHLGWDEDAINNATHRFRNVPERLAKTYYKAYEKAAISRAKQIRSMQDARTRSRR